jgi:SAM-dependent methyltransferase
MRISSRTLVPGPPLITATILKTTDPLSCASSQHFSMSPGEKTENHHQHDVFCAKDAAHLDTRLRRFLYHPDRLAKKLSKDGDRVLDFGCGPGFFTREFAKVVGVNGQVVSADLQEEMLAIVRGKMVAEGLSSRVTTHRCKPDAIDLPEERNGTFDLATAIFVVHEVPDPKKLFREIALLLKPGGTFFFSEPPFLVSGKEFSGKIALAESCGFVLCERSWFFLNRAAVLKKKEQ